MKLCNLKYLESISPDNPGFVNEMIQLFLKNVPVFIDNMNKNIVTSDWEGMQNNAHKIKSYLDCMDIPKNFANIAKQIETYSKLQEHIDLIPGLLEKLEGAIHQAYQELEEELIKK